MCRLWLRVLLVLLAAPLLAHAEPAAKIYRIGVLANALDTSDGPTFQAFLDGLRGLQVDDPSEAGTGASSLILP